MRNSLASTLPLPQALLGSTPMGVRTALVDHGAQLSFEVLRARVERRSAELDLKARSLVVLSGEPSIEFVVTYLALIQGGHVPLLANDHVDDLARAWRATTVRIVGDDLDTSFAHGRHHEIHPDLALLLSTSGSTGCPKLVRLSHRNLVANARAIADCSVSTNATGRSRRCRCTTAMDCRCCTHTWRWARPWCSRVPRSSTRASGTGARPRCHHGRRRAAHLRPARPCRP